MSKEYFWGDSLTGVKKEVKWSPSLEDEDDFENLDSDGIQHFLFIKQAVLGATAKDGERNVVEIETDNFDGDSIKQPLFSLKLGLNESSALDIGVQPPVTFKLTSGSGPVHLSGQHMIEITADDEDLDDEEEEEDDELGINASPDLPTTKSKKRPLSTSGSTVTKTKMAKLDKDAAKKEDEDDEGDGEEDEEMAMLEDDEDDEDDEDFEGGEEEEDDSDEEEDDEDDDEDDEDEEESPEKPVKTKPKGKKGQINGTTAKGDNKPKVQVKTDTKPVKPKGKKKPLALDEIKAKLQESSNVPKKEEKFKNYVRSAFHVSEAKKLQDLWGWFRASLQK